MHRTILAVALLVPALVAAQLSPAPNPNNPPPSGNGVPAGYFDGPTRSWVLSAPCTFSGLTFDRYFVPTTTGVAYCTTGRATLGHLSGSFYQNRPIYDLWLDLVQTPSVSAQQAAITYGIALDESDMRFDLHGGCGLKSTAPGCAEYDALEYIASPAVPWITARGYQFTFYAIDPTFDAATFNLQDVQLTEHMRIPGVAGDYALLTTTLVATAVPEPAPLALVAGGIAVLGAGIRRRRAR